MNEQQTTEENTTMTTEQTETTPTPAEVHPPQTELDQHDDTETPEAEETTTEETEPEDGEEETPERTADTEPEEDPDLARLREDNRRLREEAAKYRIGKREAEEQLSKAQRTNTELTDQIIEDHLKNTGASLSMDLFQKLRREDLTLTTETGTVDKSALDAEVQRITSALMETLRSNPLGKRASRLGVPISKASGGLDPHSSGRRPAYAAAQAFAPKKDRH